MHCPRGGGEVTCPPFHLAVCLGGQKVLGVESMFAIFRSAIKLLPLAFVLGVSACASNEEAIYVERSVGAIYNEALEFLQRDEYTSAANSFNEVERQHPYSPWATQAQIMAAYSYYMKNDYDEAVMVIERFIQLHPSSPDIPYAYYLKALCFYEQISDVTRDQKMTELARKMLRDLITRYPASRYTRDAKLKYDLTEDHLAGKEMEIGRYYHGQGHYLAAINRFKTVVQNYQTTTHVPEALHRLAEAYLSLGLKDQARQVASVLGHNFPGSKWYLDSYELLTTQKAGKKKDTLQYGFWKLDTIRPVLRPPAEKQSLSKEKAPAPYPIKAGEDLPAGEPAEKGTPWWKFW